MYVCPNGLIKILLRSLLKGIHPVGTSRTYIPMSNVKMHMLLHTWSNICRLNLSRNAREQQIQRGHSRRDGRNRDSEHQKNKTASTPLPITPCCTSQAKQDKPALKYLYCAFVMVFYYKSGHRCMAQCSKNHGSCRTDLTHNLPMYSKDLISQSILILL